MILPVSQHLVLYGTGSARPLCGAAPGSQVLDLGYIDLNQAEVRDSVCRGCLREWLGSLGVGTVPPEWAQELGHAA